jgi:hypothetical protein
MNGTLGVLLFLGVTGLPASESKAGAPEQEKSEAYFTSYLRGCKAGEIRCLYFLHDDGRIGMVMTIDLRTGSVYTAREVYDWATQGAETRQISRARTKLLEGLIAPMQPSEAKVSFSRSLFVAIRWGDNTQIYQYARQDPPLVVHRIYDVSGGYLEP